MNSRNKVIIFSKFAEMCKILKEELVIYNPLLITGETSSKERQRIVDLFNEDNNFRILIGTEAIGLGLNLNRANYIIMYDLPWSAAKLQQREDRAHRIGQTRPLTIYNLMGAKTIDEYVARVLHKKQKYSVSLLRDAERLENVGMNKDDIKTILRL